MADPADRPGYSFAVGPPPEVSEYVRGKGLRDSFDFFGAKNQFARDQLGAFPMEDFYLNVLAENSPHTVRPSPSGSPRSSRTRSAASTSGRAPANESTHRAVNP